jgi:hypothetical protein
MASDATKIAKSSSGSEAGRFTKSAGKPWASKTIEQARFALSKSDSTFTNATPLSPSCDLVTSSSKEKSSSKARVPTSSRQFTARSGLQLELKPQKSYSLALKQLSKPIPQSNLTKVDSSHINSHKETTAKLQQLPKDSKSNQKREFFKNVNRRDSGVSIHGNHI